MENGPAVVVLQRSGRSYAVVLKEEINDTGVPHEGGMM
jgi:hypothetical protein